jgi:hypothetical protein
MKTMKITALIALGAILVLGLPTAVWVTVELPPEDVGVKPPKDARRAVIAQQSNLEKFYLNWQKDYLVSGGDRNVIITMAWTEGLSTEPSPAQGRLKLDLIDGSIRAEVWGLDGQPADLWLVEDGKGPGMSVQPQTGDRFVRVGRLRPDGSSAKLSANLGPEFFRDFWLDLVVVSRAGQTPVKSSLLLGTRGYFERVYTRTRLAADKARERSLLRPAALISQLFSPRPAEANSTQVLIAHGLISKDVGDGADLFFRGTFGGNGRTCGTCHRVELNQELNAEFIATLPATDRLFVAEFPVNQGGVPGLERPALMRSHGLILENADGFQNPTVKFTMRGVPHSLSLATSIRAPADGRAPVERTGWSGDGAPQTGALRFFPVGAVRQHFTKSLNRVPNVDFVDPTSAQLDQMAAFMLSSGRLNDLNLGQVTLTDASAQAGKLTFVSQNAGCNVCHNNAGANIADGTNNNRDTGVETVPHPARAIENFPFDGGFGETPNRDCNNDGVLDCFGDGTFNATPLVEAADTEPFFHNNVNETLEDAVAFYTTPAFANSPAAQIVPISLTPTEVQNIAAFLRVVNAAFNVSIAIQRTQAAGSLENLDLSSSSSAAPCVSLLDPGIDSDPCAGPFDEVDGKRETADTLLLLANVEAADAIEVLTARGLHASAVTKLNSAISKNNQAINTLKTSQRRDLIESAMDDLVAAKAEFGAGLNFTLGEGNLAF